MWRRSVRPNQYRALEARKWLWTATRHEVWHKEHWRRDKRDDVLVFGAAIAVLIALALMLLLHDSKESSRPQQVHVTLSPLPMQ
jgi:hypothetical protein